MQRFGRPGGEARRGSHIIGNIEDAMKFRLYEMSRRGWTGKEQECDERWLARSRRRVVQTLRPRVDPR